MAGVYLTDFGLAKDCTTGSRFTRTGQTLGTPAYMSPEQASGQLHRLDPASDTWAMGAVLYELLTGHRAFPGDTAAAEIGAVLTSTPPPPLGQPRSVVEVLRVALQRPVQARYANAAAFGADLRLVLAGHRPGARPRRRFPWGGGALAAVLLLGGASLAMRLRSRALPPPSAAETAENLATHAWTLRRSDIAEGIRHLERALTTLPTRHEWRVQLGLLRWAQGDDAGAVAAWSGVPDGHTEATRAWWLRGLAAQVRATAGNRLGEFAAARQAWRQAAAGRGPEAAWAAGGLALATGQFAEARRLLGDSTSWEVALLSGLVETSAPKHERDPAAAIRAYTQALTDGIAFPWVLSNRGVARADLEDHLGAIADYDAALAIAPGTRIAQVNRGHSRLQLGDVRGALHDYEAVLAVAPQDALALQNRGALKRAGGDLQGAMADFDASLASEPRDHRTLAARGVVKQALGDLAGAEADYSDALAIHPSMVEALVGRGGVHVTRGDPARGIADFEAALRISPRDRTALFNRGYAKFEMRDFHGALTDFQAVLGLEPRDAEALLHRGIAKKELGDLAGAIADYDATLALDPTHANAWTNRGIARLLLGDAVAARHDLARALQFAPTNWPNRALAERYLRTAERRGGD